MQTDEQLAERFVCAKCKGHEGSIDRIAMTGSGLSRIFNVQHNQYVAVSCKRCGYTELFNPQAWRGKNIAADVLDLMFGT